ncbi:HAMP domain-containing sensor histidine kinase [Halarchaeum salinum]|uniref:sensor histidine kinase n=1 Tax=Halarchaeum salinum TaxID=489912 RepID=UPI0031E21DEB
MGLKSAALDEFPDPIAIFDERAKLVDTNQQWNQLTQEADADFLPTSPGDDFASEVSQSPGKNTTVTDGIQAILEDSEELVTEYCPFDGTFPDRRFLLHLMGFTYESDRWLLSSLVDVTEIDDAALTARERANRAEDALSIISHDVQTPLSVIKGYAELLEEECEDDIANQSLERIQSASARASTIIDDAQTLLGGFEATDRETVELATIVEAVWNNLDHMNEEASLRVEDSFTFEAEVGLLRRVFENLFINAIDHAGPAVTVRVGCLPEPKSSTVGFFVEDDGPGLPDREVENVFTPGFTSDSQNGYGLGLAIVQTIIEGHGWAITASNGATGGARFEASGIHPVSESN